MKLRYFSTLLVTVTLLTITACKNEQAKPSTLSSQSKEHGLVIDLDKELEIEGSNSELRGSADLLFDKPIYVGDNDEVSFKGDYLSKKAPITLQIGDKTPIIFRKGFYTIPAQSLKSGDVILMKDKDEHLFLEMEVIK